MAALAEGVSVAAHGDGKAGCGSDENKAASWADVVDTVVARGQKRQTQAGQGQGQGQVRGRVGGLGHLLRCAFTGVGVGGVWLQRR